MPGVEVVQGSPENIEVTAAGVDKGEALLTLADRLGIPRAQTLAVATAKTTVPAGKGRCGRRNGQRHAPDQGPLRTL